MSGSELFFLVLSLVAFVYFVAYCLFTFGLIGLSLLEAALQRLQRGDRFVAPTRPLRPGISLVVPAYKEEQVVVPATRALLGSDYDPLEVVVVDDGSNDRTAEVLDGAFDLVELPVGDRLQLPTEPVEQLFVSRADPRLRVVRKRNGGRSDALNAGINVARQPLVALVDADSLLASTCGPSPGRGSPGRASTGC